MKYYSTSKLSENMHETPEGYLICIGVPIARTGEMIYADGETPLEPGQDGKVKVFRREKDVFNPKTIASFEGKSVTILHPETFVGPENWKDLTKGILQNVRRGEGDNKTDLIADLLITDSMAIGLVKNGLREVSCGYEADMIQIDDGEGIQKNIIGNHLALVKKGRAGSGYAIHDHEGKGRKMTLKEKFLAKMATIFDEEMPEKKEEKKDAAPEKEEKKAESKDAGVYDELLKIVKDLGAKIEGMAKPKDESAAGAEGGQGIVAKKSGEEKIGDDDPMMKMEERLKACEAALETLMKREKKEEEVSLDDDDEEMEGKKEKKEDAKDDNDDDEYGDDMGGEMVGDTASRVEILAPGLKAKKDVIKAEALKAAYKTKEGKDIIDALTGGKSPVYDSAEKVDVLFIAASEVLKEKRSTDMSKSKQVRDAHLDNSQGEMTAEKMNEINAKFYQQNKGV